ncbi:MAG: hypothetical protein MI702_10140, partial [Chlorobiales bacterium]|nr:hypothetical protein [Chlorobiales bacterium]
MSCEALAGVPWEDTPVNTLCWDNRKCLWIGTRGHGLYIYDQAAGTLQHCLYDSADPRSLSWDVVTSLCNDRAGNVWIGTYGRGVNLWHPVLQRFRAYVNEPQNPDSLGVESVLSLYEDKDGMLWVAGYGATSLDIMDPGTGHCEHVGKTVTEGEGHVRVICEDRTSEGECIWLGVENNPKQLLLVGRSSRQRIKAYDLCPLVQGRSVLIEALCMDAQGFLWAGTDLGLFRFDPRTEQWLTPAEISMQVPALEQQSIPSLYADSDGFLWLGTGQKGLLQLANEHGTITCRADYRGDWEKGCFDRVVRIVEDQQHRIWISTNDGLLCLFQDTGQWVRYTTAQGLGADATTCLLEDQQGHVWVGSLRGVSRYGLGSSPDRPFTHYHMTDGLHSNEFYRAACRLEESGRLCFG